MTAKDALTVWLLAAPRALQQGSLPLEVDASVPEEAMLEALLPGAPQSILISQNARPAQALVSREALIAGVRVTLRHVRPATRQDVQAAADAQLRALGV